MTGVRAMHVALFEHAFHAVEDLLCARAQQLARLTRHEVTQRAHEIDARRHPREIAERSETAERMRTEEIALVTRYLVAHDERADTGDSANNEEDYPERPEQPVLSHMLL